MYERRLDVLYEVIKKCVCSHHDGTEMGLAGLIHLQTMLEKCRDRGASVYVIGNGGSAGIASHFCVDLVNSLKIPAHTLFDSNLITCLSNDYGYEHSFSRSLDIVFEKKDLLLAISSSGKSPNIINAIKSVRKKEGTVVTLSGFAEDNPLRKSGDLNFWLDAKDYGLVEMGHFILLHSLIDLMKAQKDAAKAKLLELVHAK